MGTVQNNCKKSFGEGVDETTPQMRDVKGSPGVSTGDC